MLRGGCTQRNHREWLRIPRTRSRGLFLASRLERVRKGKATRIQKESHVEQTTAGDACVLRGAVSLREASGAQRAQEPVAVSVSFLGWRGEWKWVDSRYRWAKEGTQCVFPRD